MDRIGAGPVDKVLDVDCGPEGVTDVDAAAADAEVFGGTAIVVEMVVTETAEEVVINTVEEAGQLVTSGGQLATVMTSVVKIVDSSTVVRVVEAPAAVLVLAGTSLLEEAAIEEDTEDTMEEAADEIRDDSDEAADEADEIEDAAEDATDESDDADDRAEEADDAIEETSEEADNAEDESDDPTDETMDDSA